MDKSKQEAHLVKTTQDLEKVSKQKGNDSAFLNNTSITNAAITETFGKDLFPDVDIMTITDNLNKSIEAIQDGDLKELEAMLMGQAKALQVMFTNLARHAHAQQYLKHYSTYMNLALKTQAQSRATIQAITELKYPRQVVVTQQANFSAGHQQVNNTATQKQIDVPLSPTRTRKNQNVQNKLMD